MFKIITILGLAVFLFASCRSTRNIKTAITKKDAIDSSLLVIEKSRADSIAFIKENYSSILRNQIDFKTFSAKIDVDYVDAEGKKYNVTAHIRMYKDSIIWVSITAIFGIEGLRAYITADSVKLLDKQNKTYTAHSVSYLQDITALPLTLSSLQDLIVGNPVFLDSNIISYSKSAGSISLLSNGSFFKNLFTIGETDKLAQSSKLDDADRLRNRTCYITFGDYEKENGINFSTERTITVSEKKQLDIKLDFRQHGFNEMLSFPFVVPKNYTQN